MLKTLPFWLLASALVACSAGNDEPETTDYDWTREGSGFAVNGNGDGDARSNGDGDGRSSGDGDARSGIDTSSDDDDDCGSGCQGGNDDGGASSNSGYYAIGLGPIGDDSCHANRNLSAEKICYCDADDSGGCKAALHWKAVPSAKYKIDFEPPKTRLLSGKAKAGHPFQGNRVVDVPAEGRTYKLMFRYARGALANITIIPREPPPPPEPVYYPEGEIESIDDEGYVTGWALDRGHLGASLQLAVYIDGRQTKTMLANEERSDLIDALDLGDIDEAPFGFEYKIPSGYLDAVRHTLKIIITDPERHGRDRRDKVLTQNFRLGQAAPGSCDKDSECATGQRCNEHGACEALPGPLQEFDPESCAHTPDYLRAYFDADAPPIPNDSIFAIEFAPGKHHLAYTWGGAWCYFPGWVYADDPTAKDRSEYVNVTGLETYDFAVFVEKIPTALGCAVPCCRADHYYSIEQGKCVPH